MISLFSKKKKLLLFIVDTKSLLLLQTRHFLLYLGIFIHSTLLCLRDKPLLQTLNRTSPSNLGNVRSRSGSKLSSLGLSFIMINQQSANLNNLFMLKFWGFLIVLPFQQTTEVYFLLFRSENCLRYDLIF